MNDTTIKQFLLENEKKTNKVIQKIAWILTFVFPLFFVGKILNIFPDMSYSRLWANTFIMLLIAIIFSIIVKKSNGKPFVKYL